MSTQKEPSSTSVGPPPSSSSSVLLHHGGSSARGDMAAVSGQTAAPTTTTTSTRGAPSPAGSGTIQDARARILNSFACLPAYLLASDIAVRRIDGFLAAMQQKGAATGHATEGPEAEKRARAEAALQTLSALNDSIAGVIDSDELVTWDGAPYRGKDVFSQLMQE